jgi:hypothetical protein
MRVTVINPDKAVGVDGEFYSGLTLNLGNEIHAIQWYDTWGEVEFSVVFAEGRPQKPENMVITDFTPYEHVVTTWQQAKTSAALEASRLAALAAEEEARILAAAQQTSETQP